MKAIRKVLKNSTYSMLLFVLVPILTISVGFSALSTSLSINGSALIKPVGMILVTAITPDQSTIQNNVSATHTDDSINVSADLPTLSDQMVYNVVIRNLGQTTKILTEIIPDEFTNDDINYSISGIAIGDVIDPGVTVNCTVTFNYKSGVSSVSNQRINSIIRFVFDDIYLPNVFGYFKPYNGDDGLFGFDKTNIIGFKRNTTLSYSQVLSIPGVQTIHNVSNDQYNSKANIYAWVDSNGVFNWWSNADYVYFHPNTRHAFKNVDNIVEVDLTGTNTSKVENFAHWFDKDRKLVRIIGKLNTSGLKLEYNNNYDYLNTADDTSSDKGLSFLFNDCNVLTDVDLSEIDTTNASDLKRMFGGCKALTEIDVSRFNTANAKSMHWMFRNCNSVTSLDLSSFNTINVVNLHGMFLSSTQLRTITLGNNFDTSNVIIMSKVFYGLGNLTTIYATRDFSNQSVTKDNEMFTNDKKLVGGDGSYYATAYNSSYVTSSRAKIATPDQSGYFTLTGDVVIYSISYNMNGGMAANPTSYSSDSPTFTLQNPTKTGYSFIGWTGSNGNTPELSVTITSGTVGNKHYEANWRANTYSVQFSANGGTGAMAIQDFTYDVPNNLTTNTFTKAGYSFNGWNTQANGSGTSFVDGHEIINLATSGTITLYAQWIEATDPFPIVFSIPGACTFNGTNRVTGDTCNGYTNSTIINTGVYLFNTENKDKDFEIGFTINTFDRNQQSINQASFVNSKLENASLKYPGFVYRITNSANYNEFTATFGSNKQTVNLNTSTSNVRIARKDKKIYYSVDGAAFRLLIDQSSYTGTFNVPVTFGGSLDANGTPYRQLINTTLSNMYIKIGTIDQLV